MPDFNDKNALKHLSDRAQQLIVACCSPEVKNKPSFESIGDSLAKNEFKLVSLSQKEAQDFCSFVYLDFGSSVYRWNDGNVARCLDKKKGKGKEK